MDWIHQSFVNCDCGAKYVIFAIAETALGPTKPNSPSSIIDQPLVQWQFVDELLVGGSLNIRFFPPSTPDIESDVGFRIGLDGSVKFLASNLSGLGSLCFESFATL